MQTSYFTSSKQILLFFIAEAVTSVHSEFRITLYRSFPPRAPRVRGSPTEASQPKRAPPSWPHPRRSAAGSAPRATPGRQLSNRSRRANFTDRSRFDFFFYVLSVMLLGFNQSTTYCQCIYVSDFFISFCSSSAAYTYNFLKLKINKK